MKGAAAWALALALAPAAPAQQPPPPPGAGAVPDSVRRLARDLARFGGCFAQRAWDDAQHVDCAAAAARRPTPTLAACVCAHRAQLARQLRRSFDVCVDSGAAYAAIIRQVGAGELLAPFASPYLFLPPPSYTPPSRTPSR